MLKPMIFLKYFYSGNPGCILGDERCHAIKTKANLTRKRHNHSNYNCAIFTLFTYRISVWGLPVPCINM